MMDEPTHQIHLTRRKASWLLVLTIPVALIGTAVLRSIITIAWCGISGCSGGGFGRSSEPSVVAAVGASAIVGVLWFGALAAVPWLAPAKVRLAIATGVGVVIAFLILVSGTEGFSPA